MTTYRRDSPSERAVVDCIVGSISEVSLHEMREAPDADLLHMRGFHVGLEIVRTIDQRQIEATPRMKEKTEGIRSELEHRKIHGAFEVCFDITKVRVDSVTHRAWLRDVPGKIASLLASHNEAAFEMVQLQSRGITGIARIVRKEAASTSITWGWRSSRPAGGTLAEISLAKKHQKLRQYRVANGDHFSEYWLAIDGIAPGVVEDGGFSMLLSRDFETQYDRVLLMVHGDGGRIVEPRDVTPAGKPRGERSSSG